MANLNKVTLIGRVGKFGEFKEYKSSKYIYNCTLATSKKIGEKEETSWHNIVMFDRVATNASNYANVGDLVLVEGEITYKKTDDGKFYTNIIAHNFLVLASKNRPSTEKVETKNAYAALEDTPFNDDIPF